MILLLYTGAVTRDLTGEQHSTWNGLALNHPYRPYTASNPSHPPEKTHNMPYITFAL